VKFDSNTFDAFTSKDIETFFTLESTMNNQDQLILETYERKNELESLSYNWKERINGPYQEYVKNEEAPEIIQYLEEQNAWLYDQGENATRGVYNERIQGIKNKVASVQKRYDNFQATLTELHNLDHCLKANTEQLNSLVPIDLFRIKNTNIFRPNNAKMAII
jgi:molecular chaperone DnaK (HSP70)